MADKKTTALATLDTFALVDKYAGMDEEMMAELEDEMADLDPEAGITCRKIKIPSGGGLAYEVQGEDESDVDYKKEINAVILFTHRMSGYWPGSFGDDDQNKIPSCSSMDGKTGLHIGTGELIECETCQFNQFGTATGQNGETRKGKACKNMRRLYMMMDADPNIYLLTVPPTSIRDVNKQLAKIIAGGVPYTGMVVKLTLEKAKNANGVEYSKVVINKGGLLKPEIAAQAKAMRHGIKKQYQNMAITADDYTAAPEPPKQEAAPDFVEIPPDAVPAEFIDVQMIPDSELPFN